MIGRRLAHYEVLEVLGEGGIGVVYLARDLELGRPAAIKVLRGDVVPDADRNIWTTEDQGNEGVPACARD
jgi:serine/threonine protein kinase